MRRLPILATLLVSLAVATMIGLGLWQLERAEEKERLLASAAAAASQPTVDLDPLLAAGRIDPAALAYRRARLTCRASGARPDLRGGRSADGRSDYVYLLPCRPGAEGTAGAIRVNVGWASLPDDDLALPLDGIVAGRFGGWQAGRPITLVADSAPAPLLPSAAPSIGEIPNNHLAYAVQWFFFAASALVIYGLALRRRGVSKLPLREEAPRSGRS